MRYEIRVAGVMSEATRREGFPELEGFVVSSQTVLFGDVVDDAHLYGLLARFQSLGLRVTEFRQLPD
ncbi:hypothetical protein [Kitasatospora sp. NPDC059571]|uniref:hypothetical protein n=1 Tax=Kitasatospora sp. NPDC059571 TaxID=3346871 RepID=UPI00369C0AF2